MLRLSAIFIAVCMVVIAASVGAVLYFGLKVDPRTAAIVALAALVAMAIYNMVDNRLRDRGMLGDQIADLSRGTADLSRQMAEMSRRIAAVESRVEQTVSRARGAVDPIAAEIGELGGLMRQLAETVAAHEAMLGAPTGMPPAAMPMSTTTTMPMAAAEEPQAIEPEAQTPLTLSETDAVTGVSRFKGLSREQISAMIAQAADANRIDLYLQPVVTLPQRKVRFYEALSRLRTEDGEIIPAGDFVDIAESAGLMPKIDHMLVFRCVQVVRRLQLKSRDVGLFCNVNATTLTDGFYFRQFLEFMEANRALAGSLTFEFTQDAYRSFGPIEFESLAALADCGFRFSLDHVTDLRLEPKELADRSFRFVKVPANLLLNRAAAAQSDIHAEDLADLLARNGIDLIGERIENESTVVDLLDYDVRFGQGFLFSPPRPVRAEALQGATPPAAPSAGTTTKTLSEYLAASASSG
ncbi:EAL domain-containing protein [Undibacter mobilis]|uniref:EAL domain-containing protein n=1 Tax=Undibacter mobilis TaxID=2292256 RepID=A0A371BBC3_9BRAD|nr:EAL domain-containing protein [Undibacter mobilis]RDV04915.1 EAL domain-containing protein [Undibacter mobilis]